MITVMTNEISSPLSPVPFQLPKTMDGQNDPWFTDKLFKVLDLFKLHEKLAPFREELELRSAVEDDENTASKPLNLPKRMMRDFL